MRSSSPYSQPSHGHGGHGHGGHGHGGGGHGHGHGGGGGGHSHGPPWMDRDLGNSPSALVPTLMAKDMANPILGCPRSLMITVALGVIVMCLFISVGQVHHHPLAIPDSESDSDLLAPVSSSSSSSLPPPSRGVSLAFPSANINSNPLLSSCSAVHGDVQAQFAPAAALVREAMWTPSADTARQLLDKAAGLADGLAGELCATDAASCACQQVRFLYALASNARGAHATARLQLTGVEACAHCQLLAGYLSAKDAAGDAPRHARRAHRAADKDNDSDGLHRVLATAAELGDSKQPHEPALFDVIDWLLLVHYYGAGVAPSVDRAGQLDAEQFVVVAQSLPSQLVQRLARFSVASQASAARSAHDALQRSLFAHYLKLVGLVSHKPIAADFRALSPSLLGVVIVGDARFDPPAPICFESGCVDATPGDLVVFHKHLLESVELNPLALTVPFSFSDNKHRA